MTFLNFDTGWQLLYAIFDEISYSLLFVIRDLAFEFPKFAKFIMKPLEVVARDFLGGKRISFQYEHDSPTYEH